MSKRTTHILFAGAILLFVYIISTSIAGTMSCAKNGGVSIISGTNHICIDPSIIIEQRRIWEYSAND